MIVRTVWAPEERAAVTVVGGDARLATVLHSPLALPLVQAALGRQAGLPWPAKLALRGGAGALLAEAPRLLPRRACDEIALAALEAALAWIERGRWPSPAAGEADGGFPDRALTAAQALGFRAEPDGEAAVRVYATPAGRAPSRVRIAPAGGGALLVASATALRLRAPQAARALAHFCLEANARLRWARLSAAIDGGTARIACEVAVPAALPEAALAAAIECVALARAETGRALALLAESEVSDAYLALRGAAPAALGKRAGRRPAQEGPAD
jgi:hypothetical protein